jgi:RimJ/RimL family protein N-acetyltransferase
MALLRGERVRIRPPEPGDVKDFFRCVNDPEASGEFDVFGITSWTEIERWLKEPTEPYEFGALAIERKEDHAKIGIVVRYISHPIMGHVEIGFQIWDPKDRNKGYGTEAVGLLVDYLFSTRNIERVQATTHIMNKPAQRVLEKCGFTREGRLRSALFTSGKPHDAYIYGITRRKWKMLKHNGHSTAEIDKCQIPTLSVEE